MIKKLKTFAKILEISSYPLYYAGVPLMILSGLIKLFIFAIEYETRRTT